MVNGTRNDFDVIIIGGGFFGCCLALFLRSIFARILIIEEKTELLTRASRVNQARVHSGFHYPRSFVTALRSQQLSTRFAADFKAAIVDDFEMLYAVARRRSKVSTARFRLIFEGMRAPMAPAGPSDTALFDPELIEGVFNCKEFAFDWTELRKHLVARLDQFKIKIIVGETAEAIEYDDCGCSVTLESGRTLRSQTLFNVTYAGINRVLLRSGIEPLALKHELAEVVLVTPPPELKGKAVTVMDGPFFSLMPFPSMKLYSLTHVRYTPHASWIDKPGGQSSYAISDSFGYNSRWRHMMMDTRRYLPCAMKVEYAKSLFEVKTVLTRNERDDGRPILLHRHVPNCNFYSVMGGKIDNIYDLFEVLPELSPLFSKANDTHLFGRP